MENIFLTEVMCENLVGVGDNSNQTILNTLHIIKIKSREIYKQGITAVKSTSNQSIRSLKGVMMCEVTSDTLKIPDFSKTGLTDASNRKNHYQTKVPDFSNRREEFAKNINWKGFVEFFTLYF